MVVRGIGFARAARRLAWLLMMYGGAFAVLWGLGLVVRGWQGWAIVVAPLAALVALRLFAWSRVSVEVAEHAIRYEGALPRRDWEVPLEQVSGLYFDRALPGAPLVLALADGDERVCAELSSSAAQRLEAHLRELGIPALRAT